MALAASQLLSISGSADTVSALTAQRQALQQQVAALGGERARALQQLLSAENSLNNLRSEINNNAGYLNQLKQQQASLGSQIDATRAHIAAERDHLGELSREQYKTMSRDRAVEMLFGTSSFGQFLGRWMDTIRVGKSISDTAHRLKGEEAQLSQMSADLHTKQLAAGQIQDRLAAENGRLLVQVAAFDARVAQIDRQSRTMLAQVASVNARIASTQTPSFPSRASSSCANHFYYGYCTWYVATRRCIPWFGDAGEWYANARAYGYPEGPRPQVGAVVVWGGSPGHVAYVESVQSDGFWISEMNYWGDGGGWGKVDKRFIGWSGMSGILGFIYNR